jgi:hypothetical protein
MIAFSRYTNVEGTEVAVVQVYPDAASMQAHMSVMRERSTDVYVDLLEETTNIQVFGDVSDEARVTWEEWVPLATAWQDVVCRTVPGHSRSLTFGRPSPTTGGLPLCSDTFNCGTTFVYDG